MHDTTALTRPTAATKDYTPADNPGFVKLHRRFPAVAYLRRHARRHVPHFAFEYMDGGAGSDGYRIVRQAILGAGRHRAHGRAVAGVAGRRSISRRRGATRARALHARPRRRHDRRTRGRDRARRALVPALPLLAQRACHRLRPGAARRGGWCPCPGAHARRSGAHHPLARGGGGHHLAVSSRPAHARRHSELARLSGVALQMGGAFTWDEVAR